MKTGYAMAVVGLACAAAAGQSVTLHFDLDGDPFNTAEVVAGAEPVTWAVWASFTAPDPTAYFGGFQGSFEMNGDAGGSVSNLFNRMGGEGAPPVVNGASIESLYIFQTVVTELPDYTNPCRIFAFDYLADASALAGPATEVIYTGLGTAFLFPDDNIFGSWIEIEDFDVVSDVLIIPGPGAAGGFVFGLLIARRRRVGSERSVR